MEFPIIHLKKIRKSFIKLKRKINSKGLNIMENEDLIVQQFERCCEKALQIVSERNPSILGINLTIKDTLRRVLFESEFPQIEDISVRVKKWYPLTVTIEVKTLVATYFAEYEIDN